MADRVAAENRTTVWAQIGNGDVDWDEFDSAAYFDHNYGHLRPDDEQIIEIVADYFQSRKPRDGWRDRAIDVGAGANLYPALTMLPFAAEVTLYERAATNCDWLTAQTAVPNESWLDFWAHIMRGRPDYADIKRPFDLLHRRARVTRGNIFGLPTDQYDIGTMFFVAESITTRTDEFERATRTFINSLRAGSPFAAAFMKDSSGYQVGRVSFPACSVDENDILRALGKVARDVTITTVESNDLRDGYGGMVVATGRKRL
ncbi:SCO2525 family SAM-dependent methyltransferase [Actinoplanes sp. NPDC051494]|uniref:SCO2525 family SAM-dependent methyltransferase n=1 Tax=Actinoplanes sp. NPDC051494 TaxID=3363907 RepID=UPI0037A93F81